MTNTKFDYADVIPILNENEMRNTNNSNSHNNELNKWKTNTFAFTKMQNIYCLTIIKRGRKNVKEESGYRQKPLEAKRQSKDVKNDERYTDNKRKKKKEEEPTEMLQKSNQNRQK